MRRLMAGLAAFFAWELSFAWGLLALYGVAKLLGHQGGNFQGLVPVLLVLVVGGICSLAAVWAYHRVQASGDSGNAET